MLYSAQNMICVIHSIEPSWSNRVRASATPILQINKLRLQRSRKVGIWPRSSPGPMGTLGLSTLCFVNLRYREGSEGSRQHETFLGQLEKQSDQLASLCFCLPDSKLPVFPDHYSGRDSTGQSPAPNSQMHLAKKCCWILQKRSSLVYSSAIPGVDWTATGSPSYFGEGWGIWGAWMS